jgi:hypothetical protein
MVDVQQGGVGVRFSNWNTEELTIAVGPSLLLAPGMLVSFSPKAVGCPYALIDDVKARY